MARFAVSSLVFAVVSAFAGAALAQDTDAIRAFVAQIDGQASKGFPAEEPGAVILATVAGEVVMRRAYGMASLELGVDVTPEMAFCLASATKPFTATAIMLLVEDGEIDLGGSVAARLDGIELDERITVEHLLSHTSGLPDCFEIEGFGADHLHSAITAHDLCRAASGLDLRFSPGARHEYCNLNYALLGRLVEVASGQSWEAFLHERVFEPAGMQRTMFGGDRRIVPGAVCNYSESATGWLRAEPLNYTRGFGLGGLFSTVDDLAAFDAALRRGKIIQVETLARMEQPPTLGDGERSGYALGWRVDQRRGHRFVHHGGAINGWRTNMVAVPASAVFVAILTNRGEERSPVGGLGMMIAHRLAELAAR